MSSFAGLSMVTAGRKYTTLPVYGDTDSGYHLIVVKNYAQTLRETRNGDEISFDCFTVGGYRWFINYYPNGYDPSCADYISLCLCFLEDQDHVGPVEVKYQFSFDHQVEYQMPMYIRATKSHMFSVGNMNHGCDKFIKRDALERSTHLKHDSFTIRCDIMICKDTNTQDISATMSDIGQHLSNILQNKMGADVTFEVSGETFVAHRCVLAARSTVFMAQLFGHMKEGTTSSVIQIKDMEAKVFRALLSFIYTGTYPEMDKENVIKEDEPELVEERQEEEEVEYVVWLQALFVAADRYDVQRLKFLCEEMLSEYIDLSTVAYTLALAEQHHCHGLKQACLKFIQGLTVPCLETVMGTDGWELIISTCPSVLKEIIAKIASSHKDNKRKR